MPLLPYKFIRLLKSQCVYGNVFRIYPQNQKHTRTHIYAAVSTTLYNHTNMYVHQMYHIFKYTHTQSHTQPYTYNEENTDTTSEQYLNSYIYFEF